MCGADLSDIEEQDFENKNGQVKRGKKPESQRGKKPESQRGKSVD